LFSLIKFALHFGAYPYSSLDPMLIELIREERRMEIAKAAERRAEESENNEAAPVDEDVREAA